MAPSRDGAPAVRPTPSARPALVALVLALVGSALAVTGALAVHLDRSLLDRERFVDHVQQVRRDPEVRRHLADGLTVSLLESVPRLTASQSLVHPVVDQVLASDALAAPTAIAAGNAHGALVEGDRSGMVVRFVDLTEALRSAMAEVDPALAALLPDQVRTPLPVTLLSLEDGTVGSVIATSAGWVGWGSRWLPRAAAVAWLAALVAAPRRLRGTWFAIGACLAGGAAVAFGLGWWVDRAVPRGAATTSLEVAASRAAWQSMVLPARTYLLALFAVGVLVAIAAVAAGRDRG